MNQQELAEYKKTIENRKQKTAALAAQQSALRSSSAKANTLSSKKLDDLLAIAEAAKSEMSSSMPERLFAQYFLPVFCNEVTGEEATKRIEEWVMGAGGMLAEVNVVDQSGRLLFIVPSLGNTDHIQRDRLAQQDTSIAQLLERVSMLFNYSQAQGESLLKDSMAKRLALMHDVDNPSWKNKRERWLSIFERYSKTSSGATAQKEDTEKPKVSNDDFDDFIGEG